MSRYVLCIPIAQQTPEQFLAYIKGLRVLPEVAPDSKSAKGIKIGMGKDGVIRVYCKRDTKSMTEAELHSLCTEYKLEPLTFWDLLTKRKFNITNEQGEVINVKRTNRKRRPNKTTAERDAHLEQNVDGASRSDQLFQSGPATNVSTEGALCPEPEVAQGTGI